MAPPQKKNVDPIILSLNEISGIHPQIVELQRRLKLPPFRLPAPADLTLEPLLCLLDAMPIRVRRSGGGYACIGNLRLYQVARAVLDGEQQISVHSVHKDLSWHEIRSEFLAELFYASAIYGMTVEDVVALYRVMSRRNGKEFDQLFASKAAFSRVMGISARRISK